MALEKPRDQRKFGRRAVFKAAAIVFDSGHRLACTVLDLSEGGAKIKAEGAEFLGTEFYLEIPEDDLSVRCQIAYIQEGVAGLKYIRPPRRLSWLKK